MVANRNRKHIVVLVLGVIIASTISFYMHMPGQQPLFNNLGLAYSDIVYGVFNLVFKDIATWYGEPDYTKISNRWFNKEVAVTLIKSHRLCPIPYRDYKFEYPPVVGFIWFATTCISIQTILPDSYTGQVYFGLIDIVAKRHYILQSLINIFFFIITIIFMYKIAKIINVSRYRILLFIFLPSTILYMIYNWDIITAAFMIIGLYCLMQQSLKHYIASGVFLGLSVATKLLPVFFVSAIAYDMIQKCRKGLDPEKVKALTLFFVSLIIFGAIPYASIAIVSYEGFRYFIDHHYQWYCENCVYMYITGDIWNPCNRVLAMIFIVLTFLVILAIDIDSALKLMNIALCSMIIATALNYVFSPQMMLMITPIASLILSLNSLLFLAIADIANFGIMATFYIDSELRAFLLKYGIKTELKWAPHQPDSPVQIIAMVRNIILILILVKVIYDMVKNK
jgi:hypothetical protein